MIHRYLQPAYLCVLFTFSHVSLAQDAEHQAEFFANLYAKTCIKHFGKPDALRNELTTNKLPTLPAKLAPIFLGGMSGTAWNLSNSVGNFVVSLRADNTCAVFARRADPVAVEKRFIEIVSVSPSPLVAEKRKDERVNSPQGPMRSISYVWFRPGAKQKLHFLLSTSSSPAASLQAMATLGMISE